MLLSAADASAAPYKGYSAFAATSNNFPCSRYLHVANKARKPVMSVLYGTFGYSFSCVNKFIRRVRNKRHMVQVHIDNWPRRRTGQLKSGEIFPNYGVRAYNKLIEAGFVDPRYEKRILHILSSVKKSRKTRLVITTGLEDNLTPAAYKRVYETIRKHWPYEIARNPLDPYQPIAPARFGEYHGVQCLPIQRPAICNQDGDAADTGSEDERFNEQCSRRGSVCIFWRPEAQGIYDSSIFIEPWFRTFTIPSWHLIRYGRLLRDKARDSQR